MRRITKLSIASAIIGIGSLLISHLGGPSQAVTIDNTPDCDTVAVFYCGAMNEKQFHDKWNNDKRYKDHKAVYDAFGIKKSDVTGMVDGIVWRDGRVTRGNSTNGEVVATNAVTAGRWNNPASDMTRISGTTRAYKMPTRHFVDHGQTAMLKFDKNGKFLFAVIKSCGNPVTAKPVPPKPPKPAPVTRCDALKATVSNRTAVTLEGRGSVANNGHLQKYTFTINRGNTTVFTQEVPTGAGRVTVNTTLPAGNYTAKLVIDTSLGKRTGSQCETKFTIAPEPPKKIQVCELKTKKYPVTIDEKDFDPKKHSKNPEDCKEKPEPPKPEPKKPGISITKKVDGADHKAVEKNVEFTYQIRVTNTGETDLKNAVVTDEAEAGVTFISASHGTVSERTWTYTISELKRGAHMDFTITAKVPEYKAGTIKNTVCVDTPDVPGKPDDCDDATVEVPEPKKMIVCELESKTYPVTINEEDFDANLHSEDEADCEETPEPPKEPETPPELPKTGATDSILNILGIGALVTSTLVYTASRRNS